MESLCAVATVWSAITLSCWGGSAWPFFKQVRHEEELLPLCYKRDCQEVYSRGTKRRKQDTETPVYTCIIDYMLLKMIAGANFVDEEMRAGARFTVSPFDRSCGFGVLFVVVWGGLLLCFVCFWLQDLSTVDSFTKALAGTRRLAGATEILLGIEQ